MSKTDRDKNEAKIKMIKRSSRQEFGDIGGKGGIHSDKRERRQRHMGTKEWLEEAEEEMEPMLMDGAEDEEKIEKDIINTEDIKE